MRKTSIDAYNRIKADGRLVGRRWQCYDCLYHHGPLTGQEISKIVGISGMWKRCPELETIGIVERAGERACGVTGENATIWDVTDRVPALEDYDKLKPEGKPVEEAVESELAKLRQENERLKDQIIELGSKPYTYVRYEISVRGKPGLTYSNEEKARSEEVLRWYMEEHHCAATDIRVRRLTGYAE